MKNNSTFTSGAFLTVAVLSMLGATANAADWVDVGLREAYERTIHQFKDSANGRYSGVNPTQELAFEFNSGEARLRHAQANVALRLTGYGYGTRLRSPLEAKPVIMGNRMEYQRGDLIEWYVNESQGLEQGFTLARRPGTARKGEALVIALAVTGGLRPVLADGGSAVLLEADGQTSLRYSGLRTMDARGHEVPSRMAVRGQEIRLVVEDRGAQYPLTVDPLFGLQKELINPSPVDKDNLDFGYSVALDGDTAVIGKPYQNVVGSHGKGAAYVYVRNANVWTLQQELDPFDSTANDGFGYSVALSGHTVVIGAPYKKIGGNDLSGKVYVFVRSGGQWSQQQALTEPGGAVSNFFGQALTVNGDTMMASSAKSIGTVYVFARSGGTWSETQTLLAVGKPGLSVTGFGGSMAMTADTLIVGGSLGNSIGAVYFYGHTPNGVWLQQQVLTASNGVAGDAFGSSVAVNGDLAVVGAPLAGYTASGYSGAAYLFARTGGVWGNQVELFAAGGNDRFGTSVAAGADTAVVGAKWHNINGYSQAGEAYVYARSGGLWSLEQQLTAPDFYANDEFGCSMAMSGDTIIVGADQKAKLFSPGVPVTGYSDGAAYIYTTARLTVTKNHEGINPNSPFVAGKTGNWIINVQNSTPGTTTSGTIPVTVTDVLAGGQTLVSFTGNGWSCLGSTTVSCTNTAAVTGGSFYPPLFLTAAIPTNVSSLSNSVTASGAGTLGSVVSNTHTVAVITQPTIKKWFGAASVPLNVITTLNFTVANPNAALSLSNVSFVDPLPSGLVVATPNALFGSCFGAPITANAGSNSVKMGSTTLAAGASCTFSLNVIGIAAGAKNNTTSPVESIEAGFGAPASATLNVVAPPTLTMVFADSQIQTGMNTTLTFTVSSPAGNAVALKGVGFTDPLPAGLVVATPNGLTGKCGGGTITALAGSSFISLFDATVDPGTSCTFAVQVTATQAGTPINTSSPITSSNGGTGSPATATTSVVDLTGWFYY